MTPTTPTVCTVGPTAVTGERCGAPAVATFGPYAECAEHHVAIAATPVPKRPRTRKLVAEEHRPRGRGHGGEFA